MCSVIMRPGRFRDLCRSCLTWPITVDIVLVKQAHMVACLPETKKSGLLLNNDYSRAQALDKPQKGHLADATHQHRWLQCGRGSFHCTDVDVPDPAVLQGQLIA